MLSISEFSQLMWKIDRDLSAIDIQYIFNEIDIDGNGDIDLEEFKKVFLINENGRKVQNEKLNDTITKILFKLNNVINKYNLNLQKLFKLYDNSNDD